jgi:hypothetical protein
MNRRHALLSGFALPTLASAAQAPSPAASAPSAAVARAAWAFFAGRFSIEAAPAAKVPPDTVWTLAPVLGGKYLELQARAYEADFRITLAWDSLRRRYAMSLLDSGSGVMDIDTGPLLNGELVLANDHGFRVRIQSQTDGWIWQHERRKDDSWLPSGAPVRARRRAD